MPQPEVVLSLNARREIISGSTLLLNKKIQNGADLRVSAGFLHAISDPTFALLEHMLLLQINTLYEH